MNTKTDVKPVNGIMDVLEIKNYLPHRYPFLLIDRVLEVEKGKSITALKNLTINELFFQGHVPCQPIMPGVLMVEALAQASGVLVYASEGKYPDGNEVHYLAGIDQARFKRIVVPGDQLKLYVEITRQRRDLWKFSGTASVDGQTACIASFMTVRGRENNGND